MQFCLKIGMGSWPALCTQNSLPLYTIHHSVLATKQTLLSILLANHALLETYLQDKDSQMDTPSNLEEPLVNAQPAVQRMKITANLNACCYLVSSCCYVILLCLKCNCYVFK